MKKKILMLKLEKNVDLETLFPASNNYKIFDICEMINEGAQGYLSMFIEHKYDTRLELTDEQLRFHEYMFDFKKHLEVRVNWTSYSFDDP